jgi:phosphocarrier protein HPr
MRVPKLDIPESRAKVVVPGTPGLSRRVAAAVVKMAQNFHSDILLSAGSIHIDAKSMLMAFILLDALQGRRVDVAARGPDSHSAVQHLSALFHDNKAQN